MPGYRTYTRRLNFFEKLTHATYPELILAWLFLTLGFTAAYFGISLSHPEHAPTFAPVNNLAERLFDSFYFSVITATTTGYGDIVPMGLSKVLTMSQSVLSLLVFTVLVGKLVSQRQDITLREVHRISFEGAFYHIRHVLFIVRKDFDDVIRRVQKHKVMEEKDWDIVRTAYLQAQSLVEEIPDLYADKSHELRVIDLKRERLLFEALHRTLDRINTMLHTLDANNIDWVNNEETTRELHALMGVMETVMPIWRDLSPYHEVKEFEEIYQLSSKLHDEIKEALRLDEKEVSP